MAISATRFKFLDNQTNVATIDFMSTKSAEILNAPNAASNTISSALADFLNKDKSAKGTGQAAGENPARTTKDPSSSTLDLSKFSDKDIDRMISDRLPDGLAKSAFDKLSSSCKRKLMRSDGFGKPYDPTVDCNGNKKKSKAGQCGSSQFSGVLNKLTGGAYNSSFQDLNAMFKNLLALAGYGYSLNMCGVFGALANGVDKNVAGRAAGALLGNLGATGNVNGFADLAAAASGLNAMKVLPSAIKGVYNNFKLPEGTKQKDFKSLNDKVSLASSALDSNWNKSSADNILSTKFTDKYVPDVHKIIKADSYVNLDEDDLKSAPSGDMAFLSAAYKTKDSGKANWGKLI